MYLKKQSHETASALEEELGFGAGMFGFSPGTSATESFLGGKLILRRIGVGTKEKAGPREIGSRGSRLEDTSPGD